MTGNLMDMIRPLLGGAKVDQIASLTGESTTGTKRALEAVVPASIAGLADTASTDEGAQALLGHLRTSEAPHFEADDAGRLLSDPAASEQLMSRGQGYTQRIFGGKLDGLLNGISGHAGTSRGGTLKLMGLAMPLVLGLVRKKAVGDNLDARGLGRYLGEQKSLVSSLLPASVAGLLGVGAARHGAEVGRAEVTRSEVIRDEARGTYGEVRRVANGPHGVPERQASGASHYLPWALAGVAAIFGIGYLLSHRKKAEPTTHTPASATSGRMPSSSAAKPEVNEPDLGQVAGQTPVADQISSFLAGNPTESKRFVISGAPFAVGSAELSAEAKPAADQLASVLAEHPKAKVRIEGFTDATGNLVANQQLSMERARAFKQYLVDHKVAGDRIELAGKGTASPTAPNDTPENRDKNRRLEIVVTP